jgi:hypothetical protein
VTIAPPDRRPRHCVLAAFKKPAPGAASNQAGAIVMGGVEALPAA